LYFHYVDFEQRSDKDFQPRSLRKAAKHVALSVAAFFLLAVPGLAQAGQSELMVDGFSTKSSLSHWQFSNGAEFPGARGSLAMGPGYSGKGAKLNFQINCNSSRHTCGHYVAAYRAVALPVARQFHAISL
jgi:hypothetical protein